MTNETQEQIEREKTKMAQENRAIATLQKRLEARADIVQNNERNYRQTWFKPDKKPLSDLELRMPDLYWQPSGYGMSLNRIAYWSTIQEEELGFNGDYSGPADENRTRILNIADHIKENFTLRYHRRQLDAKTFEKNLRSAIKNLKKYISRPISSDEDLRKTSFPPCNYNFIRWCRERDHAKARELLDFIEPQLSEHFATPYTETPLPPRVPYQAREITSEQLQEHLGEMEQKNPSESLNGGNKK